MEIGFCNESKTESEKEYKHRKGKRRRKQKTTFVQWTNWKQIKKTQNGYLVTKIGERIYKYKKHAMQFENLAPEDGEDVEGTEY